MDPKPTIIGLMVLFSGLSWGVWGQPALPCLLALKNGKSFFALLSSNPYRVREAKCLLGALASRRATGTGREDPQPDSNPFQLRFYSETAKLQGEAESKKAPP